MVANGNSGGRWAISGIAADNSGGPDDWGSLWWSSSNRDCRVSVRRNNDCGLWCRGRLNTALAG